MTHQLSFPGTCLTELGHLTLLQVDQAAPAHKALFRHKRECRDDPDLVCRLHLRADCHH